MKRLVMILGLLLLISAPAIGEQKDGFWARLQKKLDMLSPSKKISTTTAVGGVRGAKNDDSADIYWKGSDKTLDMSDEELAKFTSALESRRKGENELALKQFEEFLELYPQSQFRVEGLQAAEMIRVDIAAAKEPVKVEPDPKPQESGAAVPMTAAPAQPVEAGKAAAETQPAVVAPPAEAGKPAVESPVEAGKPAAEAPPAVAAPPADASKPAVEPLPAK